MKKIFVAISMLATTIICHAQDVNALLKEANNFELKFNESDALSKYQQILTIEPKNYKSLQRSVELSCTVGSRKTNATEKKQLYEAALQLAQRAFKIDSNNATSYCLLATACGKMTEIEGDRKKKIDYVRDVKLYADKALAINPNHPMANFIEGKWHYEMVTLGWAKKLAVKTLYGGLPEPSLDKCIEYLEKSRKQDAYFVLNYLTLAKAYKEADKAVKTIEILNLLVKLPKRNFDDAAYIEEGKKMLAEEQ